MRDASNVLLDVNEVVLEILSDSFSRASEAVTSTGLVVEEVVPNDFDFDAEDTEMKENTRGQ